MSGELRENMIAFVMGAVVALGAACIFPNVVTEAHEKRERCESSLPRTQHCVMIYVPESSPLANVSRGESNG